ncbi:MAG: hypothetical protein LBE86_01950 [Gemmobacter sp.]|jgi:hypothetical protein|nr:hypothetical protein [Gemmobacter sp.]
MLAPDIIPKLVIQNDTLMMVAGGDLVRSEGIANRIGCDVGRRYLPFGSGDLVLKLCYRARQQLHGSPAIRPEGFPQLALADDSTKVFRHNQPGEESAVTVQKVSLCASHHRPIL